MTNEYNDYGIIVEQLWKQLFVKSLDRGQIGVMEF